jgi:PA domain
MIHRCSRIYHWPWLVVISCVFFFCGFTSRGALAGPTSATISSSSQSSSASSSSSSQPRIYPQRHQDEAAVIEWGHSAIISALDAVVADFGPQTSQAALLEVETTPILAVPLNGVNIQNGADLFGNVAIVIDTHLTGYELAQLCQSHGAAAVIVVHADPDHPDDAPRLFAPKTNQQHEAAASSSTSRTIIDIPVVSISWTAANVLTTALLPEDDRQQWFGSGDTLTAGGLPDRYVFLLIVTLPV